MADIDYDHLDRSEKEAMEEKSSEYGLMAIQRGNNHTDQASDIYKAVATGLVVVHGVACVSLLNLSDVPFSAVKLPLSFYFTGIIAAFIAAFYRAHFHNLMANVLRRLVDRTEWAQLKARAFRQSRIAITYCVWSLIFFAVGSILTSRALIQHERAQAEPVKIEAKAARPS